MKLRSKKGFSLVELIIVIAILGIIAVIAVPNLTNVQKQSQLNADIRTAEQIGKAVRIWLTDANIVTANTRETAISSYTKLESLTSNDLDKYISLDYKPNALASSSFYIKLDSGKIKVVVDLTSPAGAVSDATAYTLTSGAAVAGLAYAEK